MSTRRKIASVSLDFYHFDPPWPALNCSPQSKFLGWIILNLRQKPMRSINSSFSIPNMHDICREKARTFSVGKKWQISYMILHCPSFRKSSSLLKGLMLDPHQCDKRSLFAFSTRSVWRCGLKCFRGEEKAPSITLSTRILLIWQREYFWFWEEKAPSKTLSTGILLILRRKSSF